jgi:membrane protease YdiL (CAAX protease family)
MNNQSKSDVTTHRIGYREIFAAIWIILALALLITVTSFLNGVFPFFTFVLLVVSLVTLLINRDSSKIGMRPIRWIEFLKFTGLTLAGYLALMAIFEPWSHTYQILFNKAVSSVHPDTTFGWLVRFPGLLGWTGFIFYAGSVTLFAEELFFRGWLLQWLQHRMTKRKAILVQAVLFTLPQLLPAFLLPPIQGVLYAVIYSWLAIGLIGGWAASRTQSIWPSLASAIIYNLIMCIMTI